MLLVQSLKSNQYWWCNERKNGVLIYIFKYQSTRDSSISKFRLKNYAFYRFKDIADFNVIRIYLKVPCILWPGCVIIGLITKFQGVYRTFNRGRKSSFAWGCIILMINYISCLHARLKRDLIDQKYCVLMVMRLQSSIKSRTLHFTVRIKKLLRIILTERRQHFCRGPVPKMMSRKTNL